MLNSTVTRILFDENNRAVGVEFVHDGKTQRVSVAKEVIVSGGNSLINQQTSSSMSMERFYSSEGSVFGTFLAQLVLIPTRRKVGEDLIRFSPC